MFRLTLIVAFLACAYGSALPPVPRLDGRIIGGTPADINDAPYQVALLIGSEAGGYYQNCGGCIISPTVVLTAAHCVDKTPPAQWRVRAGSSLHNTGGQVVQVTRIVEHSNFTFWHDYDIALLFLGTALNLGPGVATVPLPSQGANVPDGSLAFVTGWGYINLEGTVPTQLYKITIPIVNQQTCIDAFKGYNPVTNNMICAGIGEQDACQGDSGGPLTVNGVLIGLTSWGRACALARYPGVWTRVPALRNWIDSNM